MTPFYSSISAKQKQVVYAGMTTFYSSVSAQPKQLNQAGDACMTSRIEDRGLRIEVLSRLRRARDMSCGAEACWEDCLG